MKVDVSVGGIWHSRDIVEVLDENKMLNKFYTSRPYFKIKDNFKSVNREKLSTHGYIDLIQGISTRVLKKNIQIYKAEIFDKIISKKINNIDLLVVWSSFGVDTIKRAKEIGAKVIVERGSTHIRSQNELLNIANEFYGIKGVKNSYVLDEIIRREEEEYSLADYISIPSTFVENTFISNKIPKEKIIKIPYGVNIDNDFKLESKKINKDTLELLFVGELSVRKGVITAINAVKKARKKNINVNLTLVGKVNKFIIPYLKNCDSFISLTGVVDNKRLIDIYKRSDALVLPSIEEGMARVMLEAMSYGVPVIATENTGIGDIITNNIEGCIFKVFDEERIVEIIEEMYYDRNFLEGLTSESLQRIKKFTKEIYKKNVIEKYKDIVDK